jgi:hypothetical protein
VWVSLFTRLAQDDFKKLAWGAIAIIPARPPSPDTHAVYVGDAAKPHDLRGPTNTPLVSSSRAIVEDQSGNLLLPSSAVESFLVAHSEYRRAQPVSPTPSRAEPESCSLFGNGDWLSVLRNDCDVL